MKRLIGYTAVLCLLALTVGCGGVSSTGTLAYISNSNGTGFTVYKVNNDGTLTLSSVSPQDTPTSAGDGPKRIVFAPNGRWAYYLDRNGNNLYGYKRSSDGSLTDQIPGLPYALTGASSIVVSPGSNFLYIALPGVQGGELQVLSIDQSDGELSSVGNPVVVGYPLDQLAMNSNGSILYGLSKQKQSIVSWTLNNTTGYVTFASSTPVGSNPSFMILSANGSYIYVPDLSDTTPVVPGCVNSQTTACQYTPNIYAFTQGTSLGSLTPMSGSPFNENADLITGIYPSAPIGGVTSNDNRWLFIANQGSHNISVFKINDPNHLGEPEEVLGSVSTANGTQVSSASPFDCGCQTPAFVSVALANNGLYIVDTTPSNNRIYQYRINQSLGTVKAQSPASVSAESSTSQPVWITIR